MRPRIILIIIGILIIVLSIIPLLANVDVTISGFNIAEKVEDSAFPGNHNFYFALIFSLGLIATVMGFKSRKIIY